MGIGRKIDAHTGALLLRAMLREDTMNDFIETHDFSDPDGDRCWMECQKHPGCAYNQGRVEGLYEALSGYVPTELSVEQNAFLAWFEKVTA